MPKSSKAETGGRNLKALNITIPKKQMRLAILADWHYGSPQCQYSGIGAYLKRIQADPDCYWIANGDLMEMALTSSLGDVYTQQISPRAQINEVAGLLKPIASRCLGIVNGNHSARVSKHTSIHPDEELAQKIGRTDCYFGASLQGRIVLNSTTTWTIAAHHLTGGGRKIGGKALALERMADVWPCMDIYIGGHHHADVAFSSVCYVIETGAGGMCVREKVRHFTGAGAGLAYAHSYAHDKLMPPAAACQVVLHLGSRVDHRRDSSASDRWLKPYSREVVRF